MRKRKAFFQTMVFSVLVCFGVTACGGGGNQTSANQEKITVSVANGGSNNLILGQTVQLEASVKGVTWESSKPEIATVDNNGLVTSLAVGSTAISASKKGYNPGKITIKVDLETIQLTIPENKTTLVMDETIQLQANKDGVTWSSSDESIATVNNGLVTAVYAGEVTISAAKDGFNAGKATFTVNRPEATQVLHFEDADHYSADGWWGTAADGATPVYARSSGNASDAQCIAHLDTGDKETLSFTSNAAVNAELVMTMASSSEIADMSQVMSAKFNGADLAVPAKAFTTGSNSQFEEFSLGYVNLKAEDNALELTFLASSPYIDDLAIYAKQAATIALKPAPERETITVEAAELTVTQGKTVQINVTKPIDKTGVSYTSDKPDMATVDENGLVTGVSMGTANITIKKDGMYSARVAVTVEEVQEQGEIRLEAEQALEVVDGSSNFMALTDSTSGITRPHSGGGYITGYRVSGEETLTLKYTATEEEAGVYVLSVNGSAAYQATEDFMFAQSTTITFNGDPVTINADAAIIAGDGSMSAPRVDATLGEVTLVAGENTLAVVFNGRAPSLDFFRLVPKA